MYYLDTFSPVAKFNLVRVILSFATNLDWPLYQMDVKNVFSMGIFTKEVYIELPPGISLKDQSNKVCMLKKALYQLKQSRQAWFSRFRQAMLKTGYKKCHADHTEKWLTNYFLIVYVDDIVIASNDVY